MSAACYIVPFSCNLIRASGNSQLVHEIIDFMFESLKLIDNAHDSLYADSVIVSFSLIIKFAGENSFLSDEDRKSLWSNVEQLTSRTWVRKTMIRYIAILSFQLDNSGSILNIG